MACGFLYSNQTYLPSLELPPDASTTGLRSTSSPDPPPARTSFQPRWSRIHRRNIFFQPTSLLACPKSSTTSSPLLSSSRSSLCRITTKHPASNFGFVSITIQKKKGIHPFPGPVFYTPPSFVYSWLGTSPPRCNHNWFNSLWNSQRRVWFLGKTRRPATRYFLRRIALKLHSFY